MKVLVVLGFVALGLSLWFDSVFIVLAWVFVYLGIGAAKQCKIETGSYRAFVQGAVGIVASTYSHNRWLRRKD